MVYANNKGADQTVQLHSLILHSPISTFVVQCLDSILVRFTFSRFQLVSVAEQAKMSLDLVSNHKRQISSC